jgi:hypothetical protein
MADLRRKAFGSEVAASTFVFQSSDGVRRRVRARVGKPYKESQSRWRCPSEIRGFERRYPDFTGVDSMQALVLAISAVRARIEDFLDKGGKVLDVDSGTEWPRRALLDMFGTTWKKGRITRR